VSYGFPIISFCNPGVYYETPCICLTCISHIKIEKHVEFETRPHVYRILILVSSTMSLFLYLHCRLLRSDTHTYTHTLGRTPLDERSARRRDLYLTTNNSHKRQIYMPSPGFEPAIPASDRPQTHALDRAATGTSCLNFYA